MYLPIYLAIVIGKHPKVAAAAHKPAAVTIQFQE
jgi:hypothetical protein